MGTTERLCHPRSGLLAIDRRTQSLIHSLSGSLRASVTDRAPRPSETPWEMAKKGGVGCWHTTRPDQMLDLESTELWLPTRNRDSRVLSCPRLLGLRLAGQHAVPGGQMPRASRCLVTCSATYAFNSRIDRKPGSSDAATARAPPAAIYDRPVLDQLWLSRPGSDRMH